MAGGYSWMGYIRFQPESLVLGAIINIANSKIAVSLVVGIYVAKLPGGSITSIATMAN